MNAPEVGHVTSCTNGASGEVEEGRKRTTDIKSRAGARRRRSASPRTLEHNTTYKENNK